MRISAALALLLSLPLCGCHLLFPFHAERSPDGAAPPDARADAARDQTPPAPDLTGKPCVKDVECDDGVSCTADTCTKGGCANVLVKDSCLINGACISVGAEPNNPCRACSPDTDPLAWSLLTGPACDDGAPCTKQDRCASGVCKGQNYACAGDTKYPCELPTCDGAGDCLKPLKPGWCKLDDTCFQTGDKRPTDACKICEPTRATTSWTLAQGCLTTLAGSGTYGHKDGPAAAAQFKAPVGVELEPSGKVYVADRDNHRIRAVVQGQVSTWAGSGGKGFANGPASSAMFNSPEHLALDSSGQLLVADKGNHRIRIVYGGLVSTAAGSGGTGTLDAKASSATFFFPTGLALDPSTGQILITDTSNHRIRKLAGGLVSTVAGSWLGFNDGSSVSAKFHGPKGLAFSGGDLYVADTSNHAIRTISPGLVVATLTGSLGQGATDGTLAKARFSYPNDVAAHKGVIYVADTSNHRIRKIDGGLVSTVIGAAGKGSKDGPASQAQLNLPQGLVVDSSGWIYIADTGNNRIRVYRP